MNVQQIQYVLAVAEKRHFETAAESCFITQSTLSTMISRLEDEIGIKIFDRKRKPVEITNEGQIIIDQFRIIQLEILRFQEITKEIKGEVKGSLSIAVIPTVAPFLLPLFLQSFAQAFPDLVIKVKEQTTSEIMRQLKSRELDIGIISIPVNDLDIEEIKLYDEPFVYYETNESNHSNITIDHIDRHNLCLLEEGHCMRTQVLKLCDLQENELLTKLNFEYKAGSIDSLLRFVRANKAATLLPYLSTVDWEADAQKHLSSFLPPVPYRSVGIVVHRHFVKRKVLDLLLKEINKKLAPILPKTLDLGAQIRPL
jgi:LysR family transcriptional regulator, hydrogen peroxide-inducible genes activator